MRSLPPIIWTALPPDEQTIGRLLSDNLIILSHQVTLFNAALALADHCDAERAARTAGEIPMTAAEMRATKPFLEWKQVAARDGAITLYNFAETKQVLDDLKARSPTLFPHIAREELKKANKLFDAAFPGYADIRLSVAHSGKLSKSENESARHRIPGTNIRIMQTLQGRRLVSSINQKMAHYDLIEKSAAILEEVADLIYAGYEPTVQFTLELLRQARQRTPPPPLQD